MRCFEFFLDSLQNTSMLISLNKNIDITNVAIKAESNSRKMWSSLLIKLRVYP